MWKKAWKKIGWVIPPEANAEFVARFEGMPSKPTLFNKDPKQPLIQKQGVFEHIPETGRTELVDGKTTFPSGNVREGKWPSS